MNLQSALSNAVTSPITEKAGSLLLAVHHRLDGFKKALIQGLFHI